MTLTAQMIITNALDAYDVEDFLDEDFNTVAADRIIADLEFHGFKIVQLERAPHSSAPAREARKP